MSRQELMLAVLAAADGHPYQPVQLQKALFLITRNLPNIVGEGLSFEFAPYDYGPFDSQVYSEAERLREKGLALITPSPNGRWRTYAATPHGLECGHALLQSLSADERDYVQNVSAWVRRLSFASLVKSIYEAYPEMRVNSAFQADR